MPINLDQTGPAHLLSTDEDGLILNGSPVISKSIHVSDVQPYTYEGDVATKLLWLDTSVPGISAFPNGGQANYILRTDGMGNVTWVPPSSLDVTKFRYLASNSRFNTDPGAGNIRFRRINDPQDLKPMSEAVELLVSSSDKLNNDLSGFINALTLYGNVNRRGFIKIEKEDDPTFFQIWDFNLVEDNTTWFRITATCIRGQGEDDNFDDGDPVFVTFSVSGPEAVTQDLSSYVTLTGAQTLSNKTIATPTISQPSLIDTSFSLSGVAIGSNGQFTCTATTLAVNEAVKVVGVNAGTGVISGYDSTGSVYYIIATNGTTSFTLSETLSGPAVATTAGTVNGAMTFTANVGASITFQDAFETDTYETKLTVVKNTADRRIVLPDATTVLVGIDNTQTLSNKTIISPSITDPDVNLTFANGQPATSINISSDLATDFNTRITAPSSNQYSSTTNLYYDGSSWLKDDNTRGAWRVNKVAETTNATSKIAVTYAPVGSNNVSDTLTIAGDGIVTMHVNISSTDSSTGTLVVAGGVGIGENLNVQGDTYMVGTLEAGSLQSTPIGTTARESAGFTTLAANDQVEFTDATESTNQTTGALVVTGGVGIGKAIHAHGPFYLNDLDITETQLTGYSMVLQGNQSKLRVGPNYTAGAVDYIDIKSQQDNPIITTASDNLTIENAQAGGNITLFADTGSVIISETTAATDTTSGALQVLGGVGVSLDIHANDMYSGGSQVATISNQQTITNKTLDGTTLNNNILTGTLTANNSVGISGQILSSTGTGVDWVDPVSISGLMYTKSSDQNFFSTGLVFFPPAESLLIGTSFGSMAGTGIFTFSVAGTYQVTINYNVGAIGGGGTYPVLDSWVRKNGSDSMKYLQLLTNGSRRGSVTEVMSFDVNDTLAWYINSSLVVGGTGSSASRLTILRIS